jgi:hypothetical protein
VIRRAACRLGLPFGWRVIASVIAGVGPITVYPDALSGAAEQDFGVRNSKCSLQAAGVSAECYERLEPRSSPIYLEL